MIAEKLPDFGLDTSGRLGSHFRALGADDFRTAARYVRDLPYGRNSDRSAFSLVLTEGRGTCSTKHALLAALAREHDADVELRLGVYLMDGANTPGVADVLDAHGLAGLPEAHCYLAYRDERVDVTGAGANAVQRLLREEAIEPEQIGAYKVDMHRDFVRTWAAGRGLDPERAWTAREECIGALSGRGVPQNGG
ncbi:MAG: hypothetical protein AVDCRST_MAG02-417 [uncultured Rubrobacteraceae bacterium]|uniref:Transglutaminase-like domain-containing protein n=1 Tax=uncultured Rubrobacteraceae bacterium TaxID=349277 RepID=A0A6J4QS68_9ACTN|nr:MAG: hypothetical protein AVDCRST_MAG02-417 [uncultured Rubrobacteraceae bacterium]